MYHFLYIVLNVIFTATVSSFYKKKEFFAGIYILLYRTIFMGIYSNEMRIICYIKSGNSV